MRETEKVHFCDLTFLNIIIWKDIQEVKHLFYKGSIGQCMQSGIPFSHWSAPLFNCDFLYRCRANAKIRFLIAASWYWKYSSEIRLSGFYYCKFDIYTFVTST